MSDKKPPIAVWDIPHFAEELPEPDSTNAMGYLQGKTAPPEVEIEPEPEPLTAKELEEIRQAAYEEGLEQGLAEGKAQGVEQGRLQGLKEGHEQGVKQGLEEGLAEGEEQIRQQAARWESLMLPLSQPLRDLDHQVAEQLVVLVGDLCQQLLKVELVLNDKLLLQLLNEAIETLPNQQKNLQIKLNPDDLSLIQSHYSSEEQEKRGWVLCAEPTLMAGVCEVNTALSSVRNDINSRMQHLTADFIASNSQAEPALDLEPEFESQNEVAIEEPKLDSGLEPELQPELKPAAASDKAPPEASEPAAQAEPELDPELIPPSCPPSDLKPEALTPEEPQLPPQNEAVSTVNSESRDSRDEQLPS